MGRRRGSGNGRIYGPEAAAPVAAIGIAAVRPEDLAAAGADPHQRRLGPDRGRPSGRRRGRLADLRQDLTLELRRERRQSDSHAPIFIGETGGRRQGEFRRAQWGPAAAAAPAALAAAAWAA